MLTLGKIPIIGMAMVWIAVMISMVSCQARLPRQLLRKPHNGLYEVITSEVNVYGKPALDAANKRRIHFSKGSTIYGKAVKYGKVYRIKTDVGYI